MNMQLRLYFWIFFVTQVSALKCYNAYTKWDEEFNATKMDEEFNATAASIMTCGGVCAITIRYGELLTEVVRECLSGVTDKYGCGNNNGVKVCSCSKDLCNIRFPPDDQNKGSTPDDHNEGQYLYKPITNLVITLVCIYVFKHSF